MTDHELLKEIQALLDRSIWSADTVHAIAELLNGSGQYRVRDLADTEVD